MAVAFRSNSTYAPSVGTTNHAVSTPTGFQSGDLLITAFTNPVNATITPPSGWTEVFDGLTLGGPNNFDRYLAWKIADGTEGSSQTFVSTVSGRPAGVMAAFSGVDQTTPIEQATETTPSGAGTAYTTGTITPTKDNCMILVLLYGYISAAGTLSFTPDASYTERFDIPNTNNGAGIEGQTLLQTSAAAATGTGTASTSVTRYDVILAIRPAATSSAIKTVEGLAKASVKTVQGLAIASVKTIEGLA